MTEAEKSAPEEATVGASDIARLANVGRAAVSNWRRRFPDFPAPVGGSAASPLYSLAEVEAWLSQHGRDYQLSPGDRVWQVVRGTVDDLRLGELVGYLGAFLVFLQREPGRWQRLARRPDNAIAEKLPAAIAAAVPELPDRLAEPSDPGWLPVVRLVAEAVDSTGHSELFDFLCDRWRELHARRLTVTSLQVAQLMVDLAEVAKQTVFDPACGTGTLLLIAHQAGAAALWGQEINSASVRICAARLLLHDRKMRVAAGDSLREDAFADELADAVLCDPPFSERSWGYDELAGDPRWEYGLPPKSESELAWLQHCLAHVRPAGPVLITMPPAAASRRAGRRIRGNLLRSGALRAVISLPGPAPGSPTGPDLWVLRRPPGGEPPPSHLLVVDASADLSIARQAWQAFRRDPQADLPDRARAVRIIDLLDEEIDVSPARHASQIPAGRTAGFQPARQRLLAAAARLAQAPPELATPAQPRPLSMTTVDELVKAGLVVTHQAPLRTATDAGDTPVLTARDVRLGRAPSGWGTAEPGSVRVAAGDIVVSAGSREPVARVVAEGGAFLGPQLLLFRVDPERLDPYFLAGFLHAGLVRSGPHLSTRTDIRRTPVPRLPLTEQREYGEAFRRLAVLEDELRQITETGEDLVRLGFTGLADGTLRPNP